MNLDTLLVVTILAKKNLHKNLKHQTPVNIAVEEVVKDVTILDRIFSTKIAIQIKIHTYLILYFFSIISSRQTNKEGNHRMRFTTKHWPNWAYNTFLVFNAISIFILFMFAAAIVRLLYPEHSPSTDFTSGILMMIIYYEIILAKWRSHNAKT